MSYCENCGRPIPDGEVCCAECKKKRNRKEVAPPPRRSGAGTAAAVIAGVLIVLFALFFAAALLFGSREKSEERTVPVLAAWDGGASGTQETSSGPDTVGIDAPYAQSVLENTPPANPLEGHTYQIVVSDVTWEQASLLAQSAGGHLATITSEEEYEIICQKADQASVATGVRYLWLGAQRGSAGWTGTDCWLTGEEWTFENWYPGEPSGQDSDGTQENMLCMWNVADSGWTFNDQRNDIISALPTVSGKIGYIIEFEE